MYSLIFNPFRVRVRGCYFIPQVCTCGYSHLTTSWFQSVFQQTLRNLYIFRYLNISDRVSNSLPVICTLCPINWVVTRNDEADWYSTIGISAKIRVTRQYWRVKANMTHLASRNDALNEFHFWIWDKRQKTMDNLVNWRNYSFLTLAIWLFET